MAAGVPEAAISKQRLFVIDMTAPVTVLTSQFLAAIERATKQKISMSALISDWEEYGVLSYIDLQEWKRRVHGCKITLPAQASLIYAHATKDRRLHREYTEKKICDTTEPHARRMLDTTSQPFLALKGAAAVEFEQAVDFALAPGNCSEPKVVEAADEALSHWFPRTFPRRLQSLRECKVLFEETAEMIHFAMHMAAAEASELTVAERIRRFYTKEHQKQTMLDAVKGVVDLEKEGDPRALEEDTSIREQDLRPGHVICQARE